MTAATRLGYAGLGLIAGALWLWNAGQPAWLHALRMLAIVLIVPPAAQLLAAVIARHRGRNRRQTVSVRRLVAAKGVLIIIAMTATILLKGHVVGLPVYVAGWLVLMIALGGPAVHHRLLAGAPARPRALNEEDFRNDRIDAIDPGHHGGGRPRRDGNG
jgi:hypothetical protein